MAAALGLAASGVFGKIAGMSQIPANVSQKAPYETKASVPKVLFFLHSITPATICAIPP